MRILLGLIVTALLSACALPESNVRTGAAAPSVIVNGAPEGSVLYVDGAAMGPATEFTGKPKMLAVLAGPHRIELRQGDKVVYSEQAYIGDGEIHTVRAAVGNAP